MADEKTWTLAELNAQFRIHTGRSTTGQMTDIEVNKEINDYYVNHFPNDAKIDEFNAFFTQALSATDDGVYALSQDVDRLDYPVTINGNRIRFYRDRELFFSGEDLHGHHHHFMNFTTLHSTLSHKFEDEQFITDPTLVIGSSDSSKVKHSDFDYNINDFAYSKLSSEVDLTGDAIPQGKFGAWSLKIDTDGDITVAAADDNVTGYDTPRKALEALVSSDSSSAYMGYVTVTKSDGAFTPATTSLSATNVTATFTDGRFETRTTPVSALLYGQNLYVHPKPNDIYEFKALVIADRPTALEDGESPADKRHGPMIALNAANIFLLGLHEKEVVDDMANLTNYYSGSVKQDEIKRLLGVEIQRTF